MLPILKFLSNVRDSSFDKILEHIYRTSNLTEAEKQRLLDEISNKQIGEFQATSPQGETFTSWVNVAILYLEKAGLLCSPRGSSYQITERGSKVLEENPISLDTRYLQRFPEFAEFVDQIAIGLERKTRQGQKTQGQVSPEVEIQDTLILKSKMQDLIDNIGSFTTIEAGGKALALHDEIRELQDREKRANDYVTLLLNLEDQVSDPVAKSLLQLSTYLWLFEGSYVPFVVDLLCLLLTANGHDLYDPYRGKFATSIMQISRIDTDIKFRFLKEHGFQMIVKDKDRELRNKIAHQDFALNENGTILIRGEAIDMDDKIHDLQFFLIGHQLVFAKVFMDSVEKTKKDRQQ